MKVYKVIITVRKSLLEVPQRLNFAVQAEDEVHAVSKVKDDVDFSGLEILDTSASECVELLTKK